MDAYYWTAVNKDTGEIVESFTPYTSSGRALRGGRAYASRHWRGDKALVEVWRQPYRYSENLKIQPVASEVVAKADGTLKPGEIVLYRGERVRVSEQIGDRVNIFIPSRQELVWVKPEALNRIGGEQTAALPTEPTGTCYADAWRFLVKEEEGKLIHGTVFSGGRRIGHAWVETATSWIWEPETSRYFTRLGFRDAFSPDIESRYTAEEAAIMAARTKHFGPWTKQEQRQYLKEKPPAVIPTEPRRPRPHKEGELEFLPDSPEFLAYTIDDIGYRQKIDTAFQQAIRRAKGLK